MMQYQPQQATGKRLRTIRLDAGFSISDAVDACNQQSLHHKSQVVFSDKKLRRFEEIGVNDRYGKTPPTFEELHILMRVYQGSLAFLIWGIPPSRYPTKDYAGLMESYLNPEVLNHVIWLNKLSKEKRLKIIQLLQEVAS